MLDKLKSALLDYLAADPSGANAIQIGVPFGFTGQGAIWYTTTAPAGWLECNGQLLEKIAYPELANLLGTLYNTGGETADQFRVPDLVDKFPQGKATAGIATSGGNSSVNTGTGNAGVVLAGANGTARYVWNQVNGFHTHTVATIPPFLGVMYIIKT